MKLTVNQMLVLHEWNEKRKGKPMMEEIITLIIHEATEREGVEMALKLREVMTEINLKVGTAINDLQAIRKMETSEQTKAEMRALVLTCHKA